MKRIFRSLFSILLCIGMLIPLVPKTLHALSAAAYCLMDGDTGEILSSSGECVRLPMASTTKIMTCLVALEDGDPAQTVSVPEAAAGVEGSSAYLVAGEKQKLLDLLYAVMLQSANDAAVAVAVAVSGSVSAFVERMNARAWELGLHDTRFADPHGLSGDGHYSSAKDLCILMAEAMKNEAFAEISGTVKCFIPSPTGGQRVLINHNRLLRSFDPCVAGKTGFTRAAGRCLVSAAKRSGKTLVCATLNDPDDWNDHKALYLDGFSRYRETELCPRYSVCAEIPVVGGELSSVPVTNLDQLSLMLPSEGAVTTVLELPRYLYAPVAGVEIAEDGSYLLRRAGAAVGDAVFYQNGREVGRVQL
ncbi:MAG: D-alanyl-D-alanine carboxypeptidase, partial [Clostridia bacterium]|nr:D-alanyl-D-alanine carboxypeptidase [Clostridia bacterium]